MSFLVRHGLCRPRYRHYATSAAAFAQRSLKPSIYGQPLFQSHPHLVKSGHLTPGIPPMEYEKRRKKLMDTLPEGSVVVSAAAPIKYMSGNIFYKYRQASDFWYLTGFEEPDSAVILEKTSTSRGYKMTLFSAGHDPAKEKWDGARTDLVEAAAIFGADNALSITHLATHLRSVLSSSSLSNVYVDTSTPSSRSRPRSTTLTSKSVLKYLAPSSASPTSSPKNDYESIVEGLTSKKAKPLAPHVASLRRIKSENEVKVMRAAANASGRAHAKTMRFTHPGMNESAIGAHFEYICAMEGAQRMAYVPVVASGSNALIIHYTANNHIVREDELVLLDAGCELNGYASDITRTFPASGMFTEPQRLLYSAVLAAQKELIELCTEKANLTMYELHRMSVELLRREVKEKVGSLVSEGAASHMVDGGRLEGVLYPHFVSHPIGIDLHESSNFDKSETLKAGMVITVEPGIYVPPTSDFPKEFHNIGIRIEDEVLVGPKYPEVLSMNAPKEIVDIEGACQGWLGLEPF